MQSVVQKVALLFLIAFKSQLVFSSQKSHSQPTLRSQDPAPANIQALEKLWRDCPARSPYLAAQKLNLHFQKNAYLIDSIRNAYRSSLAEIMPFIEMNVKIRAATKKVIHQLPVESKPPFQNRDLHDFVDRGIFGMESNSIVEAIANSDYRARADSFTQANNVDKLNIEESYDQLAKYGTLNKMNSEERSEYTKLRNLFFSIIDLKNSKRISDFVSENLQTPVSQLGGGHILRKISEQAKHKFPSENSYDQAEDLLADLRIGIAFLIDPENLKNSKFKRSSDEETDLESFKQEAISFVRDATLLEVELKKQKSDFLEAFPEVDSLNNQQNKSRKNVYLGKKELTNNNFLYWLPTNPNLGDQKPLTLPQKRELAKFSHDGFWSFPMEHDLDFQYPEKHPSGLSGNAVPVSALYLANEAIVSGLSSVFSNSSVDHRKPAIIYIQENLNQLFAKQAQNLKNHYDSIAEKRSQFLEADFSDFNTSNVENGILMRIAESLSNDQKKEPDNEEDPEYEGLTLKNIELANKSIKDPCNRSALPAFGSENTYDFAVYWNKIVSANLSPQVKSLLNEIKDPNETEPFLDEAFQSFNFQEVFLSQLSTAEARKAVADKKIKLSDGDSTWIKDLNSSGDLETPDEESDILSGIGDFIAGDYGKDEVEDEIGLLGGIDLLWTLSLDYNRDGFLDSYDQEAFEKTAHYRKLNQQK